MLQEILIFQGQHFIQKSENMIYRRFYYIIIARVIILFFTCVWLAEALRAPQNIYTLIIITFLLIFQICSLIYNINSINRKIARFFSGIQDIGTFVKPQINTGDRSFRELSVEINRVSDIIRTSRFETEKQLKYFEYVVENNPSGILILNHENQITHLNKTAKYILKSENLNSLDSLKRKYPKLGDELYHMKHGDQKTHRMKFGNEIACLLLRQSSVKSENDELKIISIQNVVNELQENELTAWQKLTGVLTHEMMNSLTPISSLTLASKKCLTCDGVPKTRETIDNESITDALLNLSLIEDRSTGLKNFVTNFRRISQIPKLNLEKANINELIRRVTLTYSKIFDKGKIRLTFIEEKSLSILELDVKLIEQVLINLLLNSVESLAEIEMKTITIKTFSKDQRTIVEISDNGKGIQDDIIDNIFMPFFTTKPDGMGIGLSLAQMIMRLHKGKIMVMSTPGTETKFSLIF